MALQSLFIALFLLLGAVDSAPIIHASCGNTIKPRYNVATNKNANISCTLSVTLLDNYVWAGVYISVCVTQEEDPFGYCLPSTCELRWWSGADPQSTSCVITVSSSEPMLGDFDVAVQYWHKYSGSEPYYRKFDSLSIVSDDTFYCGDGMGYISNPYCETCPKGTYSAEGKFCEACPLGTLGHTVGANSCTPCAPGSFGGGGGSTSCSKATQGYYAPGGTYTSIPCAPGSYSLANASSCTLCPAGSYSGAAASKCTLCPVGKASSIGASYCSTCTPGTYASVAGSEICTKCQEGTYGTVAGATSNATCKACPSGSNNPSCWHSTLCCK